MFRECKVYLYRFYNIIFILLPLPVNGDAFINEVIGIEIIFYLFFLHHSCYTYRPTSFSILLYWSQSNVWSNARAEVCSFCRQTKTVRSVFLPSTFLCLLRSNRIFHCLYEQIIHAFQSRVSEKENNNVS